MNNELSIGKSFQCVTKNEEKMRITAAGNLGADLIVIMDSKGQHNPADIPVLAAPILSGEAYMVIGSRYLNSRETDTPIYRRIGQTVFGIATNFNSHMYIMDS